jgi:dipeptidyl aminopeptidase/acylaminoacyl peptidase
MWSASRAGVAEATSATSPPLVRLHLTLPEGVGFSPNAPVAPFPALSPDGRYLALSLVKGNESQNLWLHTMKGLVTRQLVTGGVTAGQFFWSPDGRSIAFNQSGRLKRVDIEAGIVQATDRPSDGTLPERRFALELRERHRTPSVVVRAPRNRTKDVERDGIQLGRCRRFEDEVSELHGHRNLSHGCAIRCRAGLLLREEPG